MNLGTLIKIIVALLLFTAGVFLVRTYWVDITPILEEILKTLRETRIRYVILAVLVYMLSVYLFAVRWQQVLSCVDYDLKATSLLPIYFGAIFINNVTPGGNMAGGESFRILWAKKRFGISYTTAFKTIFFERLVEVIPVVLLLIYVLYSLPSLEVRFLPVINSLTLKSTHFLLLTFLVIAIAMFFSETNLLLFLGMCRKTGDSLNSLSFLLSFYPVGSGPLI